MSQSIFHPTFYSRGDCAGGPDQNRTDDLLNAIEALCQLSYEPASN